MFAQVIFKNNLQIEGEVVVDEENKMVIKSLDGLITTVIPSVSDSVAFYQINHAKEKFVELSDKGEKTEEELEEIAEIKNKINMSEREKIFKNLRSSIYDDAQKQIITKHTTKETGAANSNFASGLRKMFK